MCFGFCMQWCINAFVYPLNISCKSFFAFEQSIPVAFEVTVLLASIGAVAGMFGMNGLPRPYNPLFYSENFRRATDDGFFLHIAASDAMFDINKTEELLTQVGALNTEGMYDHGTAKAEVAGSHVEVG